MLLYLFAFLAGIATVFSPCVLPVLPIILSTGTERGRFRPLGVVAGLVLSFVFFTLTLNYLVHLLGISPSMLRNLAILVIGLFGLVMLFPQLTNLFARATGQIGVAGARLQSQENAKRSGFWGGFILGSALGLVWTPCAGPILAAITTLVATETVTTKVILLTFCYILGASLPLFLLIYGGSRVLSTVPFLTRNTEMIKKCFGVLMVITAISLYYNLESSLQEKAAAYAPSFAIENSALIQNELDAWRGASSLPEISLLAPEIVGISAWVNSPQLTLKALKGKVVLLDFWTYSCINCLRTLPYLENWHKKYKDKGLVIIGVHTPEFAFEKDLANVEMAARKYDVLYPIALDNDYKTWQAYANKYWPAHYLIDQKGQIASVHFGEGAYEETENKIRELLDLPSLVKNEREEVQERPLTPETYLGTERSQSYLTPDTLQLNSVALMGKWGKEKERIVAEEDNCKLYLKFEASKVYLVMSSPTKQNVRVLLDGKPLLPQYRTSDMNEKQELIVKEPRKYDIVDLRENYGIHTLTLLVPKGISAYAFTFGDHQ